MPCFNSSDFTKYFRENMAALGLSFPTTLFDTYEKSIATATTLASTLNSLGSNATLAELAGATTKTELLYVAGSLYGSYYVGAVIGSIAVASGQSLSCGSRLADVIALVHHYPQLRFPEWHAFYLENPAVISQNTYLRKQQFLAKALVTNMATA